MIKFTRLVMFPKLKRLGRTKCSKPVYIKEKQRGSKHILTVVFDSKLNYKENINFVLKKVNSLKNVLLEKAQIFRSQFS